MGGHNMPEVWTHSRWTVVSGKEDDFVRAWRDMATWTRSQFPTATGTLLRDRDQPNVFFSFGSWPNLETVARLGRLPAVHRHDPRVAGVV
jgi:hypothetical protein